MNTSPTHFISDGTTHGPTEVATLHTVDVWAVHMNHPDPCGEVGGSSKYITHVVTHTPTGMRAAEVEHLHVAIAVADALAKNFPGFGKDATWAKEPAEMKAKPTLGADMRAVIRMVINIDKVIEWLVNR